MCRLLRVHSTGLTTRTDENRPAAPRRAPAAPAAPGWRRGSSAHPGRNPSADWAFARCRTRQASSNAARRGWPSPPRSAPSARPRSRTRPSSTSRGRGAPLRRRRRRPPHHLLDGGRQQRRDPSRSAANWSGCSASASSPPATALRVVSAPALNSRLKNRYSSRSDRRRPVASSSVALATTDSMSSVGCGPLGRDQLLAVGVHPRAGFFGRHLRRTDALREPPKSNCGSIASNSQCRSDSGTPSRMQIICIGSSAAMSTRKSNGSPGHRRASSSRRARAAQVVFDAARSSAASARS